MKNILVFLVMIFSFNLAGAQVKISGNVRDAKGRGVAGASIAIKNSYDGATTDSLGQFSFRTTEMGEQVLEVSSVGFHTIAQKITIATDLGGLRITVKEKLDELKAVMVTAGTFEAGDRKRATTVLSTLDVLTTGGANADITAAVRTLPGAQQIGDQEGLFVRGGAGYETKQYIDGTVVNNPYYTSVPDVAQRGRFGPALFKGTVFSTGGYSALYGQALSSALILESIDLPDQSTANASITPIFVGAGYQKLEKNKKVSWGANYGYTNLTAYFEVVKQKIDYFKVPQFHTADFNYRFKTKNGGMVKYYTTFSSNKLGIRRPDIDSSFLKDAFALQSTNWYNNLSWKESLGNGWRLNAGASYSTNLDNISNELQDKLNQPKTYDQQWLKDKNFSGRTRQDLSQLKTVFEKKLRGISSLRFGGEYWYAYTHSNFNNKSKELTDHFTATFAETDIYLTNNLAAKIGVRGEYSSVIDKFNVAPRLSLAYKTGKDAQASVAYGTFYQKPENLQLVQTTALGYTRATHYIANYQKANKYYTFRLEGFYKKYHDLVKTSPVYNNDGEGYAKGVELFWRDKKTIKGLDYWISYSYLDTKRDYLNYPGKLQPNFAADHTTSLVLKRWVSKISTGFNFTYSYATGRPYYNLRLDNTSMKYRIADQGETIDYHNLGFSFNYVTRIAGSYAVLVGSATNVLGSKQVFGYNYSHDGKAKEPITPPANRFLFIGLFLSWGVDRTQDAINNNL
ncbi:TonB-dependent receptor [Segetibacter sp. 3557_3]|uniref:TonB-dependent receptor n=1 Tax=Segetibacter sp. 3557_3 TaxID=2547429 RepID=UPI001058DF49|nr:TonB-dependent receptor [Segetibacter sp. 3557_3]TDH26216.1 TonB-dependent receptor [Segetibacter sp. 3557_3]